MMRSPLLALISNAGNFPGVNKLALNAAKGVQRMLPRSNTARKFYHAVRNWYEAGWPIWTGGEYSYLPSLIQDARWDQNYVTRREMMRRMRYWSQNSAIVEAVLSVGERYTVGASGLHVAFYPTEQLSADSDSSWYDRAEMVVNEWFQNCGWNGETMAQLLKVGYRCQKVDGDVFYLKTRKNQPISYDNRILTVPKPVLQMVESHRVESPWNRWEDEGRHMIDGVQFEVINNPVNGERRDLLKKVGYWVRNGMGSFEQNDSWYLIPAGDCFHIYNTHRANQYRGISDFYACEIILNKMEDALNIEQKAHASQSLRSVAIKSASGVAASPLDKRIEKIKQAMGQPPNAPIPDNQARFDAYRKETGAYVYGLKLNEDVIFNNPNRPSESTLNLFEFQINCICAATHSPRCLVFQKISGASAKSQGTEVRAELDSSDAFYKGDYQKWKAFVRDAVLWFMEWAIKNDERVSDPPPNWRDCLHIQQPEACNVDVAYNTQAQLMLLAAGATTYDDILGPTGRTAIGNFRKLAREQKIIEKLGIKVSLPALLPGQIPLDGEQANNNAKEKETATA